MLSVQMEAWGYAEGKRAVSEPANGRMFGSLRMQLHLYLWEFFLQLAGALSDNVGTTQLLQLQEEDSRASQGMTPGFPCGWPQCMLGNVVLTISWLDLIQVISCLPKHPAVVVEASPDIPFDPRS